MSKMSKGCDPKKGKGSAPHQGVHASNMGGGFSSKHMGKNQEGWNGRKYRAGTRKS